MNSQPPQIHFEAFFSALKSLYPGVLGLTYTGGLLSIEVDSEETQLLVSFDVVRTGGRIKKLESVRVGERLFLTTSLAENCELP